MNRNNSKKECIQNLQEYKEKRDWSDLISTYSLFSETEEQVIKQGRVSSRRLSVVNELSMKDVIILLLGYKLILKQYFLHEKNIRPSLINSYVRINSSRTELEPALNSPTYSFYLIT